MVGYHSTFLSAPISQLANCLKFRLISHSVNTFYHINQMPAKSGGDPELAKQEREFQIASIGFADSLGILLASLLAMPTELQLCNAQVRRGKSLCKAL